MPVFTSHEILARGSDLAEDLRDFASRLFREWLPVPLSLNTAAAMIGARRVSKRFQDSRGRGSSRRSQRRVIGLPHR